MSTTIKLQEPFSYSLQLLLILFLLLFLPLLLWLVKKLITFILAGRGKKEEVVVSQPKPVIDLGRLRVTYLDKIEIVRRKQNEGRISDRQAYIELSLLVREFVEKVTEIPASNLTLIEIKKLSMPSLYNLIAEFYQPEFGMDGDRNEIDDPYQAARRVVAEWN